MWCMQFLHIPLSVLRADMFKCFKKNNKGCVLMAGKDKNKENLKKHLDMLQSIMKLRNKKGDETVKNLIHYECYQYKELVENEVQ